MSDSSPLKHRFPFLVFLFFAFLILITFYKVMCVDFWTHMVSAKWIIEHKCLPSTNLFSYTKFDHFWIDHQWLFQVFLAAIQKTVGWNGFTVFRVVTVALIFTVLLRSARRVSLNGWTLSFAVLVLLATRTRYQIRPDMVSALFTALYFFVLNDWEIQGRTRLLWILPLLQVIWTNAHIYFFIGPVLVALYLVSNFLKPQAAVTRAHLRWLLAIFGATLLACFLNANGIRGTLCPLTVLAGENSELIKYASELKPLDWLQRGWPTLLVAAIPMVLFFLNLPSLRHSHFAIYFSFLSMAAIVQRNFIFFAFLMLPIGLMNFQNVCDSVFKTWPPPWLKQFLVKAGNVLFVIWILFLSVGWISAKGQNEMWFFRRLGWGIAPELNIRPTLRFLDRFPFRGNVFNDGGIGGNLAYYWYPERLIFIDTRDEVYGGHFCATYLTALKEESVWDYLVRKYDFQVIVFSSYWMRRREFHQFLARRFRDPEWKLVFYHRYNWVFARNTPENQEMIRHAQILLPRVDQDNVAGRSNVSLVDRIRFWFESTPLGVKYAERARFFAVTGEEGKALADAEQAERLRSWWPFGRRKEEVHVFSEG